MNPKILGSHKLPIMSVIDGKLMAVPGANILAPLLPYRGLGGGVNIPDSDIPAVKRHLNFTTEKMGRATGRRNS